jgi:hypothetical protein
MVLAPMTELEAVNRMLASIGQAPVNTLPPNGISDAAKAYKQLRETARDVQTVGYCWNTDEAYELTPDASDSAIVLPNGTLDIDATAKASNYVSRKHPVRGVQALYDRDNHTFEFDDTVEVDIVWGFEFDDLPQPARSYIATAAARRFQAQVVSSTVLDRFNAEDEDRAFQLLQRYERRCRDTNSFRRNPSLQRWTRRRAF